MLKVTNWNLKLLQAFVLVAENQSFRRAADESLRSHSAVSAQIKDLEDQLGVRLFERTTRRVALTPEGAELLEYTRRAFSELAVGIDIIRKAVEEKSERIRFACIPTITPGPVTEILSAFEYQHPDVVVNIRELNNEDLIAAVKNREVSFGIGVTVPSSECRFDPLFLDEMSALVALDAVPAKVTEIALSDLIEMPLFLPPQATPTLHALEKEARRRGISLNIRHRFTQPQTIVNMAAAGHGAGLIARVFVDVMNYTNVRALTIVDPRITRQISVITRRGSQLSKTASALIGITKEVMRAGTAPV